MMRHVSLSFFVASLFASISLGAAVAVADKPTPPKPALPPFKSLRLEPEALTLHDARDSRKFLVLGERADGGVVDLTDEAKWTVEGGKIEIDAEGFVSGREAGEGVVSVTAAGRSAKLTVKVAGVEAVPVGFVKDIEPILSKAGCNAGPCHGADKGKNGFKLSLRGYDGDFDYQSLVNDLSGRRLNRVNVDESLMLLKPLAEVPHEGRQAIKPGSRYHQILKQWITEGAKSESVAGHRPTKIEVLPAKVEIDLPGRRQQLLVVATYADGSTRDVTREAVLSSNNEEIALVKNNSVIALRRGEMAVLVRYEGVYDAREVVIMGDRSGFEYTGMPDHNFVDTHVQAKWRRMKINPSELCTDAEFIRRAYLDLTGQPPSAEKTRAFLKDETDSRKKRDALVEALIGSPAYGEFWANKLADLLQCNSENLGKKGVWVFRNWIRDQLMTNRPYDQFVKELVTAKGSTFENPAGNYLRALRDPGKMTEDISQTFLGVRFNCNKCHDHPFERWTQNQYYEFGAYFAQLAFKRGTLGRDYLIRPGETYAYDQVSEEILYHNYNGGEGKHPKTDAVVPAHVPYGKAREPGAGEDRRAAFADWLVSKENPYFAKSTVNRFWSYFFSRGIIDPVDDIRAGNPPSNGELLEALTKDFIEGGYDLRRLMRTIVGSRTYQLSITANRWNDDDTINFSRQSPRRLSAEQMLDAIAAATGHRPKFQDLPVGMRAVQVPDGKVAGNDFLMLFGRPKRQSACECERSGNVTLSHALNLINGKTIGESVGAEASRIAKLVASEKDDGKVVEEIYLSCLSRMPTSKEMSAMKLGTERLEGAQDLAWALMNTPAFLFNR